MKRNTNTIKSLKGSTSVPKHYIPYLLKLGFMAPCMPVLYYHGKRILKNMPDLQPPSDTHGLVGESGVLLKLVAIGESTIAGIGIESHQDGLVVTMANELAQHYQCQIQYEIVGQSGFTAQQTTKELLPKVETQNPDIIIIGLGGNDTFQLNFPWRWRKHVQNLIQCLQHQFGARPILFLNMPPVNYFPAFPRIVKYFGKTIVNTFKMDLKYMTSYYPNLYFAEENISLPDWVSRYYGDQAFPLEALFSDGIHPNQITYQVWGKEISKFIITNQILFNIQRL